MSVCKYSRQPARGDPGNSCSSTQMWRTLLRRTFIDTTFETSAPDNNRPAKSAASTTLAQKAPGGWIQVAARLNNFGYALRLRAGKQWFVAHFFRALTPACVGSAGFFELLPSSHPGQVSVAKVLLGVFGVAVVVVVIAVPTAIFLNGESHIPFTYWHSLIHEDEPHASSRTICPCRISRFLLNISDLCLHHGCFYHRISDLWPFTTLKEHKFPHVLCVSEDEGGQPDNRKYFTLEDVFNSSLKPQSYGLRWISGQDAPPKLFILCCYSFTFIHPLIWIGF